MGARLARAIRHGCGIIHTLPIMGSTPGVARPSRPLAAPMGWVDQPGKLSEITR